jgi:hypothetical protein
VGGARKGPQAAAGNRPLGRPPVLEGDRVVALAPYDQRRHRLEQIEPVGRADALASRVDHRAQGLQEGLAGVPVLERPQRPGDRLQVGAASHSPAAHAGAGLPESAEQLRLDRRGEHLGHAGQGGRAQQRSDLPAETAARDERKAFDALGELVEELHRDAAAERVPDDRRPLDPDRREQVADAGGVSAERVVPARRRRITVPDQVGRDHRVAGCKPLGDGLPVARGVEHAVDQDDGRPAAGDPVDHAASVQGDLPLLETRHVA